MSDEDSTQDSSGTIGPDAQIKEYGPLFRIGEVAELIGLSLRTVRFYEEEGLVIPLMRTEGGFRLYDDDCIQRFRIIMQMKPLGFTVDEMRLLIDTRAALAQETLDEATRMQLRERRSGFAALAEEKVRSLREQLAIAEQFSTQLSKEASAD